MAKKAARNAALTPQKCTIESIPKLGQHCARVLKSTLDLTRVVHNELPRSHGVTTLYFQSVPPLSAEIANENRPIIQIGGAVARWLHVSIDLRAAAGLWYVRHVSIDLLKGDLAAEKESLLRAEWMMHDSDDEAGHAQPHWHALYGAEPSRTFSDVVTEPTGGFDEFLEEFSSAKKGASVIGATDIAFKHFHYAMASDWHRNPSLGAQHALEDEAALLAWLGGCIAYIRRQLAHVDRKAGRVTNSQSP